MEANEPGETGEWVREIEWHLVWFVNGSLQLFKSMRCSIDLLLYSLCTLYTMYITTNKKNTFIGAPQQRHRRRRRHQQQHNHISVGTAILFNLNINNLLQREVNWRYVDIWKQCQQQRQEQRMTIFYSCRTNERNIAGKLYTKHTYIWFSASPSFYDHSNGNEC